MQSVSQSDLEDTTTSVTSNSADPLLRANQDRYHGYSTSIRWLRVRRAIELLEPEKAGHLLDVGCVDGRFAEYFRTLGWTSFGLDVNHLNATVAAERGIKMTVADFARNLPFADNTLDAVVCLEVLEHIIDTRSFLHECRRVLRPNGCLVLSTPNLARLENRFRLAFGRYPYWMDYELETGSGHVRYYTLSTLGQQLITVG